MTQMQPARKVRYGRCARQADRGVGRRTSNGTSAGQNRSEHGTRSDTATGAPPPLSPRADNRRHPAGCHSRRSYPRPSAGHRRLVRPHSSSRTISARGGRSGRHRRYVGRCLTMKVGRLVSRTCTACFTPAARHRRVRDRRQSGLPGGPEVLYLLPQSAPGRGRPRHRETLRRRDRFLGRVRGGQAGPVQDQTSPFFTTAHFDGHPSVLLRASRIGELTHQELAELIRTRGCPARRRAGRQPGLTHTHMITPRRGGNSGASRRWGSIRDRRSIAAEPPAVGAPPAHSARIRC
jgi:hypothetical protein